MTHGTVSRTDCAHSLGVTSLLVVITNSCHDEVYRESIPRQEGPVVRGEAKGKGPGSQTPGPLIVKVFDYLPGVFAGVVVFVVVAFAGTAFTTRFVLCDAVLP